MLNELRTAIRHRRIRYSYEPYGARERTSCCRAAARLHAQRFLPEVTYREI